MFKFIKIMFSIIIGIPTMLAIIILGIPICFLSSNNFNDLKQQYRQIVVAWYKEVFNK